MAVYKVIQDVEAEDKLLGPLSLKGFIYAIIAVALGYINFRIAIATDLGTVRWLIMLLFFFPMLLFGVLASPLGRDQPTEIWLLSRVRFFLQSRKRVWDQSGASDLVTITAPKLMDRHLTKNLSQQEVNSRLRALATTLDSRGWAVKNVAVNLTSHPDYLDAIESSSDRLVGTADLPNTQATVDVHAADDIMDEKNNATAQHFEALMQQADTDRKKEVMQKVQEAIKNQPAKPKEDVDLQFLDHLPPAVDEKGRTIFVGRKIISPSAPTTTTIAATDYDVPEIKSTDNVDDAAKKFLEKKHKIAEAVHAKAPLSVKPKPAPKKHENNPANVTNQPRPAVTEVEQAAKLKELSEVAKNDKLSTLAQMAKRGDPQIKQIGPNEVEISLH